MAARFAIPRMTMTHLLFDFFGTLVSYSTSRSEQGFEKSHRLLVENGARIDYDEFLSRWAETFERFETLAQTNLDEYSMNEVCEQFLDRALPRTPDDRTVALFRDTWLAEWSKGVKYVPGVVELIADLAGAYKLVLVTNTHHAPLVHGHLNAMGITPHFSVVVTSVEHGKRKPSACIFDRALALSAGTRQDSVFVGDSFTADYLGAISAGLRCLLIDPERRHDIPEANRLGHVLDMPALLAPLTRPESRSP